MTTDTKTRPIPPVLAARARDIGYLEPMLDGVTLGLLHHPGVLTPVHVEPIAWGVMLDALPTIVQGQTADLKYDSGTHGRTKVWRSRMTKADGALADLAVEVEHLNHLNRWVDAGTCSADFDGSSKIGPDPSPLLWSAYVWTYYTWLNTRVIV
jgi:hypothetical protein